VFRTERNKAGNKCTYLTTTHPQMKITTSSVDFFVLSIVTTTAMQYISMWKGSVKWAGKMKCRNCHTHENICLIQSSDPPQKRKKELKKPSITERKSYRDIYLRK